MSKQKQEYSIVLKIGIIKLIKNQDYLASRTKDLNVTLSNLPTTLLLCNL